MIQASGFGQLVSNGPEGLTATGLPFLATRRSGDVAGGDDATLLLRGHLARANTQWRHLDGADALVIFSPTDGYVSPSWYPSKAENPRVVPTWNYEVVHAHGRVAVHDDPQWTADFVRELTDHHERERLAEHSLHRTWSVDDAPDTFITTQLRAIVGIEVVVDRVEGKRKLSQNRSDEDQLGVIRGLAAASDTPSARGLADAMRNRPADPDR